MEQEAVQQTEFLWRGNILWLDFVNTEIVAKEQQVDLLDSPAAVWAWLAAAGAMSQGDETDEAQSNSLLHHARELRAALRTMADCMTRELPVPEEAVSPINQLLRQQRPQLVWAEDGWRQEVATEGTASATALLCIAKSAAETLTSRNGWRVRQCQGQNCILYFYDLSKNHKRRWCSMAACGNRHKSAEHYRRSRPAI